MTWTMAIYLCSSLLALTMSLFIQDSQFVWSSLYEGSLPFLAAAILVMGGMLLAVSLTGTVLTNLAVSGVILFLPRIYMLAFNSILSGSIPFIRVDGVGYFSSMEINILFRLVTYGTDSEIPLWVSCLYSLVLGLIYLELGLLMIRKRPSEAAGQAAVNNRVQSIIRILITFTICLIPISGFFAKLVSGENSVGTFGTVACYVLAFVIYLLYEVITTRKWKKITRTLPGLGVVALANVLYLLVLVFNYHQLTEARITVADVTQVRIREFSGYSNYYEKQLQGSVLQDETLARDLAERFNEQADVFTQDGEAQYNSQYPYSINYTSVTLSFRTGFSGMTRVVYLSEADWNRLGESWLSNEETLAEVRWDPGNASSVYDQSGNSLSSSQLMEVYRSFRKEILTLSGEEKKNFLAQQLQGSGETELQLFRDDRQIGLIMLTEDLPQTLALYQKYEEENSRGMENTLQDLTQMQEGETLDLYLSADMDADNVLVAKITGITGISPEDYASSADGTSVYFSGNLFIVGGDVLRVNDEEGEPVDKEMILLLEDLFATEEEVTNQGLDLFVNLDVEWGSWQTNKSLTQEEFLQLLPYMSNLEYWIN